MQPIWRGSYALARGPMRQLIAVRTCTQSTVNTARDDIMEQWDPERFDKHFIDYFSRKDIDGWEVRKG